MRLDKFLSNQGVGSRKEVKELIKSKQVHDQNGLVFSNGKIQIDPEQSTIFIKDRSINYQRFFYYMLNKPQDVVTATTDRIDRTVMDCLNKSDFRADLFPVGRLDKDTTGLLLLTNDGQLAHHLLSPNHHVNKKYRALVSGIVTKDLIKKFEDGIQLKDFKTAPAKLEILDQIDDQTKITVTIQEGKYHQVKRMFQNVGHPVLELERLSMGNLILDESLKPGQYRPLSNDEVALLKTNK